MKPIKVKVGSGLVKIYEVLKDGNRRYQLNYRLNGKLCRPAFGTLEEARAEATRKAELIDAGQVMGAGLTNAQAAEFLTVTERLKPFGLSLSLAVDELLEARRTVGTLPLLETLREAVGRKITFKEKPVPEVVEEYLALKQAEKRGQRHLRDLRSRLRKFAKSHIVPVHLLTRVDVKRWIMGLKDERGEPLSPRSRWNYAGAIRALANFAKEQYAPKDWDELDKLEAGDKKIERIEVWTPEELAHLFTRATKRQVPLLAIGAFGGLRSAEISTLRWEDIRLDDEEPHIVVDGKTGRRIVHIHPSLAAWLRPYVDAGARGRVLVDTTNSFSRLAKRAKVTWKRNGLRHSFISYRVAETSNIPLVAGEAGNSVGMIKKHYLKLVLKGEALKWFAVQPDQPRNIVELKVAV